MTRRLRTALAAVALLAAAAATAQSAAPAGTVARKLDVESITAQTATGDFDQILKRGTLRVMVPVSRTLFFNDKGTQRGLTADLMHEFERHLNRRHAKALGKRRLIVYLIPATRDELFADVAAGRADIAAGNLSITEQRLQQVDFARLPDGPVNHEVIATGPKSPPLSTIDDLAGQTVHVRRASSYYATLLELNQRFVRENRAPMRLVALPDALEDEDTLEMLSVGLLGLVVIDDWKGRLWAQLLPGIKVREDLALKKDVKIGLAIRKGSPLLKAEIEAFLRQATRAASVETRRLMAGQTIKRLRNNTEAAEMRRFDQTLALFEKYGARYGFDPLMLMAQAYQESRLRQDAVSPSGAIGIMQVLPATGAALKVGDITQIEPNIHAGTKYLHQLMTRYFPQAGFSEADRPLFAFASYNAGPGRVAQLRQEAARRGLDPDVWFNHVELVATEKIGMETPAYVRSVFKYYVAYTLMLETQAERRQARESLGKS